MDYKSMNIEELVSIVNGELGTKSLVAVAKELFNSSESALRKYLNNRHYRRDKATGLFILVDTVEANTEDVRGTKKRDTRGNYNSNVEVMLTAEEIAKLKLLLSRYDEVMQLLDNSNTNKHYNSDTTTVNIVVAREVKTKQFKIDNEILEQWQQFVEKNSRYKVQDLISTAMLYFIENFK